MVLRERCRFAGMAWAVCVAFAGMAQARLMSAEQASRSPAWLELRGTAREQVEAVPVAFDHWDNPALYAFLQADDLPAIPGERGILPFAVPWASIREEPGRHRYGAMAVDARFLTSETVGLSRPAAVPGGSIQRWVVQWGTGDDDVAVVLLPDQVVGAGGETTRRRVPLRFARVMIPARFLGLWSTKDRDGEPFDFPVFVAADAAVYDRAEHASGSSGQAATIAGVVLLAAIGAAVWWRVNARGWESRNHRRRREALHDQVEFDDETGDDLADHPAEALGRLTDRD
ncbi:MAG: hypothetical protein AAGI54_11430 [Planctomycetota bacterium]